MCQARTPEPRSLFKIQFKKYRPRAARWDVTLCGAAGGDKGLYERLSAMDSLRFFGTMYGLHGAALRRRAAELLHVVGLAERAQDRAET
jgi:ABC-2 type transport system ATP-binding protein